MKQRIEEKLSVSLQIDSETGNVEINLKSNAQDPSLLFRAREVVTAVGRGFSPRRAFTLIRDDEAALDVFDLRETVGRSPSDLKRLKGRIIGKAGKTRRIIEELSEVSMSVYGHTVAIIGTANQAAIASEAVRMLLRGSQHRTVYQFLQRKRSEMKKKRMDLWETRPPPERR